MAEAITLFYSIYQSLVSWIFGLEIVNGVYVGWVLIVIIILCYILSRFKFISRSSGSGSGSDE